VVIDNLALDMDCRSGDQFECVSECHSETEVGSCADEHHEIQQLERNELQRSINLSVWNRCENWKDVMETNKNFFQGVIVSTHMGADFNPDHKRNQDLISLLDVVYVVSYDAPRELRESDSGSIVESRWMGACCFMLSCDDPLFEGLIFALRDDEQLFTGYTRTCDYDPCSSFVVHISSYDHFGASHSRTSATLVNKSQLWTIPRPITARDVYSDLKQVAQDVETFGCKAMSNAEPTIFWVRAREFEVDVLERLWVIISKEIERCDQKPRYHRIEI
jgi:hypothetical protein